MNDIVSSPFAAPSIRSISSLTQHSLLSPPPFTLRLSLLSSSLLSSSLSLFSFSPYIIWFWQVRKSLGQEPLSRGGDDGLRADCEVAEQRNSNLLQRLHALDDRQLLLRLML